MMPSKIIIAERVKINGDNLYGRKFILKPVNKDKTDIVKSITITVMNRFLCVADPGSPKKARSETITPMNMSVRPSVIHSMYTIRLLSFEISPNPFTTDFVGIRWAMHQMV